jgi:hypothetical protein
MVQEYRLPLTQVHTVYEILFVYQQLQTCRPRDFFMLHPTN